MSIQLLHVVFLPFNAILNTAVIKFSQFKFERRVQKWNKEGGLRGARGKNRKLKIEKNWLRELWTFCKVQTWTIVTYFSEFFSLFYFFPFFSFVSFLFLEALKISPLRFVVIRNKAPKSTYCHSGEQNRKSKSRNGRMHCFSLFPYFFFIFRLLRDYYQFGYINDT